MKRVPVTQIVSGMVVGLPGDHVVRIQWMRVETIQRNPKTIVLHGRDVNTGLEGMMYIARRGESLRVR